MVKTSTPTRRRRGAQGAHLDEALDGALELSGNVVVVEVENFNRLVQFERRLERLGAFVGNAIIPEVDFFQRLGPGDQVGHGARPNVANLVAAQILTLS